MTVNISTPPFLRQSATAPSGQRLYLREEELDAGVAMLFEAVNTLKDATQSVCAKHKLTWTQARALATLSRKRFGVHALSANLGLTKQATIKTVEDLEKRGLLHRVDDPRDGRRKTLVLAQAGEVMARDVGAALRVLMASAYRQAGGEAVAGCDLVLAALIKEGHP